MSLRFRHVPALIASLSFVDSLPAQTAASSPPSTSPIVELSPFTVVSDQDTGYRAQNTLAGSRLNSSHKGTPGVLDVLTKDFLDEIGAITLEQALNFSPNYRDRRAYFVISSTPQLSAEHKF